MQHSRDVAKHYTPKRISITNAKDGGASNAFACSLWYGRQRHGSRALTRSREAVYIRSAVLIKQQGANTLRACRHAQCRPSSDVATAPPALGRLRRSASHARIDWVWFIISQMAFGLTSGLNVAHAQPMATMQTWPLATRASVEAIGIELGREHD